MKVNGTIVTLNLDIKNELELLCPNIQFINIEQFYAIRYFSKAELICVIIDIDSNFKQMENILEEVQELSTTDILYCSTSFERVYEYNQRGTTVLKNSTIISNEILDIYAKRVKLAKSDYIFDMANRTILYGEHYYKMRNTPFLIFNYLVNNKNRTCTRQELIRAAGVTSLSDTRTIDVHINYIRRLLKDKRIKTVVGEGYKFEE